MNLANTPDFDTLTKLYAQQDTTVVVAIGLAIVFLLGDLLMTRAGRPWLTRLYRWLTWLSCSTMLLIMFVLQEAQK